MLTGFQVVGDEEKSLYSNEDRDEEAYNKFAASESIITYIYLHKYTALKLKLQLDKSATRQKTNNAKLQMKFLNNW